MSTALINQENSIIVRRSIITDVLLLALFYFVPTISHLLAFPLYWLDPMRIVLFASLLLSRSKVNAFVLAATLPLFSYFFGGHPVFIKSCIIGIELVANLVVFFYLISRKINVFVSCFISIVAAKLLYYILKVVLIRLSILDMDVISTGIIIQVIVTFILSMGVYWFYRDMQRD